MSDLSLISVPLDDLFISKRGNSKYTRKYCNSHSGIYEVYTGTTIGSFGKIHTYDYEKPNLTYTTDGEYAGTVKLIKDEKYNIGGHRGILISKDEKLYLEYFHYILEPILKSVVKGGSVPSITWNLIKDIEVLVPTRNGEYDLEEQKKIANNFCRIEEKKNKLLQHKEKLNNSYITFTSSNYKYVEVDLSDIFEFKRGGSCTKAFCNANKGNYPVYSANNLIPLAYINTFQYSGKYITLSRNGIAGKITIFNEKFTVNEDRFVLIPKVDCVDYEYIKYTLEPILRGHKRGRIGHNGQNEFTKLSFTILNKVKLKLPITDDGLYDLVAQKEIANKYNKIEKVKQGITNSINQLVDTKISLE